MNKPMERQPLTAGRIIRAVVIFLIAVAWLVPSVGLLVTSFRPQSDIAASGWWQIVVTPRFTTDNYNTVLTAQHFFNNFINSFIITIPATILPIIIGALAAYSFAWMHFRGRNLIFMIIVALLVLPLQETWIPVLRMHSALGLTKTYLSIWLAHTAYGLPFAIFLLRNFFSELPKELFEASYLDGYSDLGVFARIVLPLSVPALASLGIFQFVWVWNDLMNALVLLQDLHKFPLTVAIQNLLGSYGSEWNLLASGAFISMSIPLLVFFLLQRYFVQGLTAGAVKG
ncbi:MAG: carbohydrate ABC transporter permease [Spirochaetia bacterium]|jgi:alpha-glucoside transport system permease protein